MAPTVTEKVLIVSKEDDHTSLPGQRGPATSKLNLCTDDGASEGENAASGVRDDFGRRPDCFKSTFQEVSFVFQATMATATSSFLTGVCLIVTASIGRDLGMTQGQISWITASTRCALSFNVSVIQSLISRLVSSQGLSSWPSVSWQTWSAENSCS